MQTASTAATGSVIRVRGLVKRYGEVKAVDGIDFDVAPGEVFGLLGPNGAGKTTTVEILEGLRAPDGGEAIVLGVDVAKGAESLKPRIGVSLQTASLGSLLLVAGFVTLGAMAFLALGYVIASFAKTEDSANGMTSMIQFPMMFLSGAFFQIDQMPQFLQVVARIIPLTYLADALRQVMVGGAAFAPLWVCAAVLLGWLVVCFGIASRKFAWQ